MDKELINELTQGDFSKVKLNEWFTNITATKLYNILATIDGCDKNLDSDMLYFISIFAKHLFMKTKNSKNNLDSWDKAINENCKIILKKVIAVGCKHYNIYHETISQLIDFEDDEIRLHCCANIESPIYLKYLNDKCARIRKVAAIRQEFDIKSLGTSPTSQESEQINFIVSALNKGVIEIYEIFTPHPEDEIAAIKFTSLLFDWNNEKINPNIMYFDFDILKTIPDKRILAYVIHDWIKDGTISFKEDMIPECFKNSTNPIEMEIKEAIDEIHKKTLKR